MQDLHVAMWRLVEIEERRDKRDAETLARDLEDRRLKAEADASVRAAWGSWARGLVSRDVIVPLLAALAGAGGVTYGVRTTITEAPQAVTAPAPPSPSMNGTKELP